MLAAILITFIILDRFVNLSQNKKLILATGVLMVVIGVSFALGTDYLSYEYVYKFAAFNSPNELRIEPGFMSLIYLSRTFNIPYHLFSFIIRSFILIITVKWIQENSEKPMQSVILYFAMFYIVWTMSALRQGLTLALTLYLLFNPTKNISLLNRVLIAVGLSLFHSSVLAVIPILLLAEMTWTRKKHLVFLSFGLFISLLPIHIILDKLSFLPLVSTVALYLTPNFGFFDFSSIVRLFFFGTVIFSYNQFTKTTEDKFLVDLFLLGTPIYLLLKSSEITASRINIYTFVIIVILLPKLFSYLSEINVAKFYVPVTVSLAVFSFVFMTKELNSHHDQIRYNGTLSIYNFNTIFDIDYGLFDNIYAYLESEIQKSKDDYLEFKESAKDLGTIPYSDEDTFMVAQDPFGTKFGVLSNTGQWLRTPKMNKRPSVQSNVLIESVKQDLTSSNVYTDLSMKTKDQDDLFNRLAINAQEYYLNNVTTEESIEGDLFSLIDNPETYVPFPEHVKKSRAVKLTNNGYSYHVLYVQYYHYDLYIYLDENLVPFNDRTYKTLARFNADGFLETKDRFATSTFNTDGELILMVPYEADDK